jgi:uncharacterized protein
MPVAGRTFAGALAVAAALAVSGCDATPPVGTNPRQVTVVGSGEVRGAPDTLTADVGIEVVAADAATAMNQNSERQRAVIEALTGGGIDPADIATTSVSLQPQTGEDSAVTGYRASNSIEVRVTDLNAGPEILATVVRTGGDAARINSVRYSITEDSELVGAARAKAFADARNRAGQYAELSGLALGTIISISEAAGGLPPPVAVPVPREAPVAADIPLEPGEQTVSFTLTAVWELI